MEDMLDMTISVSQAAPAKMFRFSAIRYIRQAIALCIALALTIQPAAAQSILRDAETEALFQDMAAPLIKAAKLDPRNVDIILIGDNSINAFVAGGQAVYIHSGLINAAENANEVQGVIAHELGHVAGGHVIRSSDGIKEATGITLLSLVLGAAAIAAGAGEAGMGILGVGQQAALGKYLAFSRTQESSADLAGSSYLSEAGVSGRGSLAFFKKLQNLEFRLAIPQEDSYGRTHPLSGERISVLQGVYEKDPAWNAKTDAALEARFQRVKAKLQGFSGDPAQTMREYPDYNTTIPAHYARAYAWHKWAYPDKALAEADALLAKDPKDPYFLELKGQILLESGKPEQAIEPLREAVFLTNNQPLIASLFGHALVATEQPTNYDEAAVVLKAAVAKDNQNPFAWYQLGVIYSHQNDEPRARLASAEGFVLERNAPLALRNATAAMGALPEGSPDWIRAQDIAILARIAVEEKGKKRR